jgi:hypothetical protein
MAIKSLLITSFAGILIVGSGVANAFEANNPLILTQQQKSVPPILPTNLPASKATGKSCSVVTSVISQPMPSPGQTHRSSQNISLDSISVGQVFKVNVTQGGRLNSRIKFNLKRDIRHATDPTLVTRMHTGYYKRASNYPLYPVYIADPSGAGQKSFRVTFSKC